MDQLEFVRKKLAGMDPKQVLRVAADAELSIRTVYNVANSDRDVYYSTVKKLHDVLSVKPARKKK